MVLSSVEETSTVQEDKSKPDATTTETPARKRRPRLKPSITPTARTRRKPASDTVKTPQETNESLSAATGIYHNKVGK